MSVEMCVMQMTGAVKAVYSRHVDSDYSRYIVGRRVRVQLTVARGLEIVYVEDGVAEYVTRDDFVGVREANGLCHEWKSDWLYFAAPASCGDGK